MAVTAWVLVHTEIGKARSVCDAILAMQYDGVSVLSADTVTGPHDVIARLSAPDLDSLSSAVENVVSSTGGVENTITCLKI